jgi:hypothetical protein
LSEWLLLAAGGDESERARARAAYEDALGLVSGAGLRGLEIKVRLAAARAATEYGAAIEALKLCLALADSVRAQVPAAFRSAWAARSGYLDAVRELARRGSEAQDHTLQDEAARRASSVSS